MPLAPQAVAILRAPHPLTGHGRYVLPSLLTGERCMSENTVRGALRRMGYGSDDMTAHGFRAMARTMIAERLGIAPEVTRRNWRTRWATHWAGPTTARNTSTSAAT